MSQQTGPTPGPWFVFDDEIVAEPGDQHIATVELCDGTNPTEWQANMRLIAAALDLLAALKACLPFIDDADDVHQLFPDSACSSACRIAVMKARAAIQKAEGSAPADAGEAK